MARSFNSVMRQAARAAERAKREAERRRKAQEREQLRLARTEAKEAKLAYFETRERETLDLNDELRNRVAELRRVLLLSPETARPLDFNKLKKRYVPKTFDPSVVLGPMPHPPVRSQFATQVPKPGFIAKLFGAQAHYEAALEMAITRDRERFEAAHHGYQEQLTAWQCRAEAERAKHESMEREQKAQFDEHDAAVDEFECRYRAAEGDAVIDYFSEILDRSILPEGFPETHRIAYSAESRQLVVEHDLPTLSVVPEVAEYSYTRAKDEIREKPRKKTEIKEIYNDAIAGTCLRILNEIFSADSAEVVDTIVLNGLIDTLSPSTGEHIRPCVVSVRVSRAEFSKLVLARVEPVQCLQTLGVVSKRPEELIPVRPLMDFNMADKRFVAESDVLCELETRPNIMELNPFEFENLVTNVFSKMGLEAKQTRSSRDGGVDAVAFDPRPVLGGKVVIQAKRYKNTVGVAAVRDLYGTMINEGASKGILVTTAGYGPDAFEFAKNKPIELIDGRGLLYLLGEQGIEARILMPV